MNVLVEEYVEWKKETGCPPTRANDRQSSLNIMYFTHSLLEEKGVSQFPHFSYQMISTSPSDVDVVLRQVGMFICSE